jgi:hypothetical protein
MLMKNNFEQRGYYLSCNASHLKMVYVLFEIFSSFIQSDIVIANGTHVITEKCVENNHGPRSLT